MHQRISDLAETLARYGVADVVISPGSRSAPLVGAFTRVKNFTCHAVADERSAGFIALGIAQQSRRPAVLICTSGTAALNFYPAIAEAFYQRIPLIVLTADRPPELLDQQDGQMIHQERVYGKHVLGSYQLTADTDLKKLAGKAFEQASGRPNGPVHINLPLREPLYLRKPGSVQVPVKETTSPGTTARINRKCHEAWAASGKRVILLGQMPVDYALYTCLHDIARAHQAVILCDPLANQHAIATAPHFDILISKADPETLALLQPDCLISAGGPLVSKSLKLWLKQQRPAHHIRISEGSGKIDTYDHVTHYESASLVEVLTQLKALHPGHREVSAAYFKLWKTADQWVSEHVEAFMKKVFFNEWQAVHEILNRLPDAVNLQVANSSAIRYVSMSGKLHPSWTLNGNRGTSGIDGCTSTAVGAALANNKLTVLLTGDLGFLYDRNALWNNLVPDNLRIIVLNNKGGGIFTLIDGPGEWPDQLSYFTTPHQQHMRSTALDNGLEYYFCDSLKGLKQQLKTFFNPKNRAAVLEIETDMMENAALFKSFKKIPLS